MTTKTKSAAVTPPIEDSPTLSLSEAARYIRKSPWTMRKIIRDGKIPYIEGRPKTLLKRDLDNYLERQRRFAIVKRLGIMPPDFDGR